MPIVKVYWEPETPSTQHRRLSPASHARRAGTECKVRSIVYARSIAHGKAKFDAAGFIRAEENAKRAQT